MLPCRSDLQVLFSELATTLELLGALCCAAQVGYCQGMNFVAGLLLMYLPERHAFGGLVVLMQDRGLRKYYSTDMSLLQVSPVTLPGYTCAWSV